MNPIPLRVLGISWRFWGTKCLLLAALLGGNLQVMAQETAAPSYRPIPSDWRRHQLDEPVFGSQLFVVEAGPNTGPAVLLVHGLGQNGLQDWWEVILDLSRDHRVIALDLPGFGRSATASGQLSPARYARLLAWLARELELSSYHLVGHSMGGAVALYHAGTYPEQVESLVLVNAAGILQRAAFLREQTAGAPVDVLPAPLAQQARRLLQDAGGFVERIAMLPEGPGLLRNLDVAWGPLLRDRPNMNAALALLETDFSPIIANLSVPTSIIWGDQDSISPLRTAQLLHGRLPRVQLLLVPGAQHVPMQSHPTEFMQLLRQSLATPATRPRRSQLPQAEAQDYLCRNQRPGTLSGSFRHILLENCGNVHLFNLTAESIIIRNSRVQLTHAQVQSTRTAIQVEGGTLTGTDVRIEGQPAIVANLARIDLAGASLRSRQHALEVGEVSTLILSVSDLDSSLYRGYLHGAVRAAHSHLDDSAQLSSRTR